MVLEQLDIHMQKMKLNIIYKTYLKMDQRPKCKS